MVETHPDDKDLRLLATSKSNLAMKAGSLTYTIVTADNDTAKVAWVSTTNLDAGDILNPDTSELHKAEAWLRAALADGPIPSKDVEAMAKADETAWITVRRAKVTLDVECKKDRSGGSWRWPLAQGAQDAQEGELPIQKADQRNRPLGFELGAARVRLNGGCRTASICGPCPLTASLTQNLVRKIRPTPVRTLA